MLNTIKISKKFEEQNWKAISQSVSNQRIRNVKFKILKFFQVFFFILVIILYKTFKY